MVDAFNFVNPKCQHYFLTHMHSDHTTGLTKSFSSGTIYASAISARLLAHEWGLRPPTVQVLELGRPTVIQGVTITAIDANHCPGAVMLVFEVPKAAGGVNRVLHTGDCRWQDCLRSDSCLRDKRIDILMLDTTYAVPRWTFPPQQQAIETMVQVMQRTLHEEPATLFVVGSYHIGKERAYLGAAQALGIKVYAAAAKRHLLHLLDMPAEQLKLLTADASSAGIHVGQLGVTPDKLQAYLKQPDTPWKRVVGFRPTGWSYKRSGGVQVWREGAVEVVGIPYSEHSSWNDLRACVAALRPKKIIPTVNAANPEDASRIVERFADLMDHSSNRSRIDMHLVRLPTPSSARAVLPATLPALMDKQDSAVSSETAFAAQLSINSPSATPVQGDSKQAVLAEATPVGDGEFLHSDSTRSQQQPAQCGAMFPEAASGACAATVPQVHSTPALYQMAGMRVAEAAVVEVEPVQQTFDLSSVDVAEQKKLLEHAEQLQRMKRVREQLAAAKSLKRRRSATRQPVVR
eukprot:GHUV01007874.1.p1 GENE.GHUV01007874.1~~GHUV01007874.1.p1  ORF type:complete len:518 (+),score=175.46 GHUV01007874.1:1203-2756(+)